MVYVMEEVGRQRVSRHKAHFEKMTKEEIIKLRLLICQGANHLKNQ